MGYRVIAIDAGQEKEQYCLSLGAEVYLDGTSGKDVQEVRASTGGEDTAAVIVCAGRAAAYQSAFSIVGGFGIVVCMGIPPPLELMQLHPIIFIDKGIRRIGSVVGSRADIEEALNFVERRQVILKVLLGSLGS